MESDEGSPEDGTITIDTSGFNTSMWSSAYTVAGGGGTIPIANGGGLGATSYNYTTMAPSYNSGLICTGDADFKGDLKVNGKSIVESLAAIEKRLSILTPDPKKLAKYEALQKAYAHYKTIEAMCHDDE